MSTKTKKSELLSPAGSFDAARAAVNAGADAIYMGGSLFSARAFAESSENEQLLKSIEFCHLRGVRVFMTLNTLIKERELAELCDYIDPYARAGLDGVIVQDLGVMRLIKREFPGLELHVSTQAAVTGPRYAGLLKKMGASRIVLARELSLEEIKRIYDETGAELEVFAHGALCYSCSGQCLMSSFIGGRSGNRGRCAGTCRLPFEVCSGDKKVKDTRSREQYVLSMKDLCTVGRLSDMLRAGVFSFKIEGRMKSPLYVAAVTGVYRKYLDMAMAQCEDSDFSALYSVDKRDMELISEAFERGGHTDGYLDHKNGREMITLYEKDRLRIHDEAVIAELRERYIDRDKKIRISGYAEIEIGMPPGLTLRYEADGLKLEAAAVGDTPVSAAVKRPVTEADIREKLSKFGGTDFELTELFIDMNVPDGGCFVPLGSLNELRRRTMEELRRKILQSYIR